MIISIRSPDRAIEMQERRPALSSTKTERAVEQAIHEANRNLVEISRSRC